MPVASITTTESKSARSTASEDRLAIADALAPVIHAALPGIFFSVLGATFESSDIVARVRAPYRSSSVNSAPIELELVPGTHGGLWGQAQARLLADALDALVNLEWLPGELRKYRDPQVTYVEISVGFWDTAGVTYVGPERKPWD